MQSESDTSAIADSRATWRELCRRQLREAWRRLLTVAFWAMLTGSGSDRSRKLSSFVDIRLQLEQVSCLRHARHGAVNIRATPLTR